MAETGMDKYLDNILAGLILNVVAIVCSHFFDTKGQEIAWELPMQTVTLEEGDNQY